MSFINCVYEGCASGRDLLLRTTVHSSTTTMMMTTQKTAVLMLELFIYTCFRPVQTQRAYPIRRRARSLRFVREPAEPWNCPDRPQNRPPPRIGAPTRSAHYR